MRTSSPGDAPPRPGPRRRPAAGWALLAGTAVALAYLAGAVLSGWQTPLARRPLLDGLAPVPPYRWVKPPPELTAGNRPPADVQRVVRLTATGSEVSAVATGDGQASLVMEANAVASSPGQREVAVSIEPLDPATVAPAPAGLVLAGNTYRVTLTYRPSGRPARLSGKATAVLVYPLLPIPVDSLFDYTMLASPGPRKAWTRLTSTATPGSHQVAATLTEAGYLVVGVPPAPAAPAPAPNRIPLIAGLAAAAAVVVVGAIALLRRGRGAGRYDEDEDDDGAEYEEDGQDGDGRGSGGSGRDSGGSGGGSGRPGPGPKEGR